MKMRELKTKVADKTTGLAGSAAGTVADPGTGLNKLGSVARKPTILMAVGLLAIAYLLGRVRRHRT